MACTDGIIKNIVSNCATVKVSGLEPVAYVFSRKDASFVFSTTQNKENTITGITLATGKKAYTISKINYMLLTAGTNKAFFNILDGMWAQIEADIALAPNNKIYRYTITENAAATKTDQLNLASDTALKVFRALYANIPAQAFGRGSNLVIQCTRSLLNNWIDYLEGQSLGFTLTRAEQGSNQWQYRGIPIVPRPEWDNIIRTYFDNGTTWHLPHRAILADINAIPIGTSDTNSLYSLTSEYNSYHKKHVIDFAYRIDCKVVDEELVAVAV